MELLIDQKYLLTKGEKGSRKDSINSFLLLKRSCGVNQGYINRGVHLDPSYGKLEEKL
jgi:hypothetical protein